MEDSTLLVMCVEEIYTVGLGKGKYCKAFSGKGKKYKLQLGGMVRLGSSGCWGGLRCRWLE
jgi:hypothetical protein